MRRWFLALVFAAAVIGASRLPSFATLVHDVRQQWAAYQAQNAHALAQAIANGTPNPVTAQMLRALSVQVLQARFLPPAYAQAGNGTEFVDVELRVTNRSAHAIHLLDTPALQSGCPDNMGYPLEPETLLPASDSLFTLTPAVLKAMASGSATLPPVYLNLQPHQTKVGWVSAQYLPHCGYPNEIVFSDNPGLALADFGDVVSIVLPYTPSGPPLAAPASAP